MKHELISLLASRDVNNSPMYGGGYYLLTWIKMPFGVWLLAGMERAA